MSSSIAGCLSLAHFRFRSRLNLNSNSSHVLVITAEGLYQAYAIDLESGGECALVREYQYV